MDEINWVPRGIQATVSRDWFALKGTADWDYKRHAASNAVSFVPGVKAALNDITTGSTAKLTAVNNQNEKAFVRDAELDARLVKVVAEGGTLTLSGSVRTRGEKGQASSTAWNAPEVPSA